LDRVALDLKQSKRISPRSESMFQSEPTEKNSRVGFYKKNLNNFLSLDSITLVGKQEVIDSVIELLDEKKKGWEANAEDRALRNYSEIIEVHQMFHPKIIGQKVYFVIS
jgi:hypothetical protein